MSSITIRGQKRLSGEIYLQGSKNSALPLMAATLLCKGTSVLHNCPVLSDVDAAVDILRAIGCSVLREGHTVTVNTDNINCTVIPDELMREMRSSVVFLGAILARCLSAVISYPGGCELGPRPIDLHLSGMRSLGAVINEEHGTLECFAPDGLKGADITLILPSVGATENIMLAAVTAKGRTVLRNAAREPEISDLADFLNRAGAKIRGAGESTIVIDGVSELYGTEHTVIPDRIAAATYMAAAAITRGDVTVKNMIPAHVYPVIPAFLEAGCAISVKDRELSLTAVYGPKRIKTVRTLAYPGFPTDAQPPVMAMCTVAPGTSVFVENIFDNRFKHAGELMRLGAKIKVEGKVAVVEGVDRLTGAAVKATDLRGGAALCVAALAAEGETVLSETKHIMRGYEDITGTLYSLGADIR